jgi:hypothetical protein
MPFMGIDFFTIITTIFWIWMLIDCLMNKKLHSSKIFWFLLILFTQWIGALIYFFCECRQRNPLTAFASYWQIIMRATTYQSPAQPYMPPSHSQQPSQRQAHAQQMKTPPITVYPNYPDYARGYQAPPSPPSAAQRDNGPFYQTESQAEQAEYEQPTATYPELPQQQQP